MSWHDPDKEDNTIYKVVLNHEEQYSIWPSDRENPLGWNDAGKTGLKAECLSYIKEVWTDMRPLSLRKKMEEDALRREQLGEQEPGEPPSAASEGDDLVTRLSNGEHPVEMSLRPEKSLQGFKERLDMKHVHIKFTSTRGGTELGVRLDDNALEFQSGRFRKPDRHGAPGGGVVAQLCEGSVHCRHRPQNADRHRTSQTG